MSILSFSFSVAWLVLPTMSILSLTFLGTLLGETALAFLGGCDVLVLWRSLEVLISVSLSNVFDLATVTSVVCLSSGWLLLVSAAELLLVEVFWLFRQSITAVSATWWSWSSKSFACCRLLVVMDGFLLELPEWSSLSNTEWWVSTGSLLAILKYKINDIYVLKQILFRIELSSWMGSACWWRLLACACWVLVKISPELLYKYPSYCIQC